MNPQNEGQYRARSLRCHACVVKERAASHFPPAESAGLFLNVERDG